MGKSDRRRGRGDQYSLCMTKKEVVLRVGRTHA